MEQIKEKTIKWLKQRDTPYQIITWLISSLFLSNISTIVFVVFMSENHIFSYDFFINGLFGLSIFFIFTAFFLILYGLFLSGFIIFIMEFVQKFKAKEKIFGSSLGFAIITLSMNILFQYLVFHKFSTDAFIAINFIGAIINLHIGSLILCSTKIKLYTLILLIVGIFYIIMTYPKVISNLVEIGLKNFNSGGKVLVDITTENNLEAIVTQGKLILLTPNKVFVDVNSTIKIMDREGKVIDILKH